MLPAAGYCTRRQTRRPDDHHGDARQGACAEARDFGRTHNRHGSMVAGDEQNAIAEVAARHQAANEQINLFIGPAERLHLVADRGARNVKRRVCRHRQQRGEMQSPRAFPVIPIEVAIVERFIARIAEPSARIVGVEGMICPLDVHESKAFDPVSLIQKTKIARGKKLAAVACCVELRKQVRHDGLFVSRICFRALIAAYGGERYTPREQGDETSVRGKAIGMKIRQVTGITSPSIQ